MALQGELTIGGRKYGIVECAYEFSQSIDDSGKPTSRPKGGTITFVLPSTNDSDSFFYSWMFNKTETHAGVFRFVVFTNNNKRSYKTVAFTNAFCVGVKDYFNNNDSKLMYTTVTISAEMVTVSAAVFNNEWT
jgi:hypothetical protein